MLFLLLSNEHAYAIAEMPPQFTTTILLMSVRPVSMLWQSSEVKCGLSRENISGELVGQVKKFIRNFQFAHETTNKQNDIKLECYTTH